MKLSEIGEFGLIDRFSPLFSKGLSSNLLGIGDDCAVIPLREDSCLLLTTDLLMEDVHFIKNEIGPKDLGYKSLAVNLSDIAAMGGTPKYFLLSLTIPPFTGVEWLDLFFSGLKELASEYQVNLIGGDTTRSSEKMVINIALIGETNPKALKLRSTARPGDIVCVTNKLGDSAAGLMVIQKNLARTPASLYLISQHHHPAVQLKQGQWLGRQPAVTSLIDISDGLKSDLGQIIKASECGARVLLEKLPLSTQLCGIAMEQGWSVEEFAAVGGEDYCLLATVASSEFPQIAKNYEKEFGSPLYEVGQITDSLGKLDLLLAGRPIEPRNKGYQHF